MARRTHGNQQKYENRNPVQRLLIGRFLDRVVATARRLAPRTVLEVGCGEGHVLAALADAGLGAELRGVDLSPDAVATATARLGGAARVDLADARTLASDGATFDLVLMLEVLEHIREPRTVLPLLSDLSAAGHVLLSVPWEPWFRGLNLVRGRNVRRLGNDPEHVNHWTRASFTSFVEQRFEVVDRPPVFPWAMVLAQPSSGGRQGRGSSSTVDS